MKKLIFVNRYFYPDYSATSQMLSDLAFGLACQGGFQIHVITSRQLYNNAQAQLSPLESAQGVKIHRVRTSTFGRSSLVGRAIDYLSFYISAALTLWQLTDKHSIVVAKTDPPMISVVCAMVAKFRSAQLVNWIQDLFPEVAAKLGVKVAKGPFFGLLRWLRNSSLRAARINVVIGELMKQRLIGEGISADRIQVIHNWADGDQIQPIPPEQNPLRNKWGLDGKFVVGYSGNLGRGHDFNTILDAATALRDNEAIVFLIIGAGANLEALQTEVKARGLHNILFKPYQPRETLSESLSAADVHLISLKPELEGLIVPSKFYGIAAAGRPVLFIGTANGEIAQMIDRAGCGYAVAEGDVITLQNRILELSKDGQKGIFMGNGARAVLESFYGKNAAIEQWKSLVLPLL